MLNISVIVCTYNRVDNLKDLLDCLLLQEMDEGSTHEVIVINNNSKDKTEDLVKSYLPKFQGKLRYFFESRQGKPYALNLGIKEARGEILAFTDDDCTVGKDYLANVYRAFRKYKTGVDFIGGRISPQWIKGNCPEWLDAVLSDTTEYPPTDERYWRKIFFRGPLGILDYGNESFEVDSTKKLYETRLFYGANMGIKKDVFNTVGDYSVNKTLTQDTEICLRLTKAGKKGLYAPDVKVYHKIIAPKVTAQYYYKWYFLRGKYFDVSNSTPKKFYHPLGIQNEFIVKTMKLFVRSLFARSTQEKIHCRCQVYFNLGQMGQIAKKNIT